MAYTDIDKPTDYFETKLYTGNGGTLNVTGLDFAPNWVWIKSRSSSRVHCLFDTVRGATKRLQTNEADAEYTTSNSLTGFNSDGFSLGSYNQSNEGSANFVSWNWKAGTSFSNSAGANGASIASTGSVNTTAGFSIIRWTGSGSNSTVAHGLGAKPDVIIIKNLSNGQQWSSYWSALGATKYMRFNTSNAVATASNRFANTEPTTSVFTVSTDGEVNQNGLNLLAYCFAEKQGYSKFGSYIGNGNADGTFVYTGFKPAFVIRKVTSASSDWIMQDNKRSESGGSNQIRNYLFPNSSQAEVSNQNYFNIDFLSNGFKMRSTDGGANGSGSNYIYMAFAEESFVSSTGVPATAR